MPRGGKFPYSPTPLNNFGPSLGFQRFLDVYVTFFELESVWWPLIRNFESLFECCVAYRGIRIFKVGTHGEEKV